MNLEKISWSALGAVIAEASEHFGVDSIDYLLEELNDHPNNIACVDKNCYVDLFFKEDGYNIRDELDKNNW